MKQTELKVLSELMKNSKISDRELAKIVGVSQPTVTRTRRRLEEKGYIKEYTLIPDFAKLGFELMGVTLVHYKEELTTEEYMKVKKKARDVEKRMPHAILMILSGMGLGYERIIISFHENYSSFAESIRLIRQHAFSAIADIESFLVSLTGEDHYHPLTFSTIANYLLTQKKRK